MNLLEIKNFTLKVKDATIIENFSLTVENGEVIGLYAPSGTGKSSLLKFISGISKSTDSYQVSGEKICDTEQLQISYCFQEPRFIPNLSIYKNLLLSLSNVYDKKASEKIIDDALESVNLLEKKYELPQKVSGGQLQRASLVRALLFPCNLLLLDEPFVFQDKDNLENLLNYTEKIIKEKNLSAIIVSHNKQELERLCTRIMEIQNNCK